MTTKSASNEFGRFAVIGALAFGVDTAVLYLALGAGLGFYAGRLVSWLAAATFTWYLNRRYTFTAASRDNPLRQWLHFLAANAVGGVANYGAYAALVAASGFAREWPVVGVAAGSLAGLLINFTLSRRFVFRRPQSD